MVRKAVIVAAGYGSRFFPVTRAIPKEMLPIGTRPALDYVVSELVEAGIEELLVITSRRKRAIEDWFDRDPELDARFPGHAPPRVKVAFVRQERMGGTGDALALAAPWVGDEPFAVAFPDDLFGAPNCTAELIAAHRAHGGSILATLALPPEEDTSRYGILDLGPGGVVRAMVEKPPRGTEPSREVSLGRYVFTPELFAELARNRPTGHTGEYFHVPAINALAARGAVRAVRVAATRYDTGTPRGLLATQLAFALEDPLLRDLVSPRPGT